MLIRPTNSLEGGIELSKRRKQDLRKAIRTISQSGPPWVQFTFIYCDSHSQSLKAHPNGLLLNDLGLRTLDPQNGQTHSETTAPSAAALSLSFPAAHQLGNPTTHSHFAGETPLHNPAPSTSPFLLTTTIVNHVESSPARLDPESTSTDSEPQKAITQKRKFGSEPWQPNKANVIGFQSKMSGNNSQMSRQHLEKRLELARHRAEAARAKKIEDELELKRKQDEYDTMLQELQKLEEEAAKDEKTSVETRVGQKTVLIKQPAKINDLEGLDSGS
ncbi:hypothetical protein MMC09_005525 [Bachmanniomyces sp. S44760]|nr:hypothetical protein [Bachmanniomyces sp. S44760]